MSKASENLFKHFTRVYAPILGVLIIASIISRLAEYAVVTFRHGAGVFVLQDALNATLVDLQIILIASIPLFFLCLLANLVGDKLMASITAFFTGLMTSLSILLSVYYAATLTPLGPELWAYSMSEMRDTVIAAEGYLEMKIVALIIATMLFMVVYYKAFRGLTALSHSARLSLIAVLLICGGAGVLATKMQEKVVSAASANKLSYFLSSGVSQMTSSDIVYEPLDYTEYPFLKRSAQQNVLAPYFRNINEPPNVVFVLVESLGGEFVGNNAQWGGFAPFIDSLAANGLYWENGLSMSGRTFGMIPSLLGSLPPGDNGFMDLGPDYPSHTSVIRMLGDQGYHTSFYSGYNTYFDGLNYFLDYQGIDLIINKEWISDNYGSGNVTNENYWGYDDKTLFDIVMQLDQEAGTSPRLEIYHTLQTHSPFTVPQEKLYAGKFTKRLEQLNVPASKKESFRQYRAELTTLMFTDDALREFFNGYREKEGYSNTIFVITGDHWLIPVPQTTRISRYHVPIIIYSELLKEPVQFKSVNTHANVAPALTTFLKRSAGLSLPDSVHWIGGTMDTVRTFRNIHSLPLMQNKNQLSDYISGSHFLNDHTLYKMTEGLNLTAVTNEPKKQQMARDLSEFRAKNSYAVQNNKLYPLRFDGDQMAAYGFISEYASMFDSIDAQQLSVDEQFEMARSYAFDGDYDRSRAIAKRLLLEVPDYHDIRILLGRTYAWNREYEHARAAFRFVQEHDPDYYDTYNALADAEYWAGNYYEALSVINTGLSFHSANDSFLQKKIKILMAMDRPQDAKETFSKLKNIHPSHENITELERQLF